MILYLTDQILADAVGGTICVGKPKCLEDWVGGPRAGCISKPPVKHGLPFDCESPVGIKNDRWRHFELSIYASVPRDGGKIGRRRDGAAKCDNLRATRP